MINQVQEMGKAGQNPDTIIDSLLQQNPNNQMLQAIKGKSPEDIMKYAENVSNTMGIK